MPTTSILYMLLGAALVAVGVLASALADRVRGVRVTRETAPRERNSRARSDGPVSAFAAPDRLPIVVKMSNMRSETTPAPSKKPDALGDVVITALIGAGYRKPVATEATWACDQAERITVEAWTRAALRRCARGATS